MEKSKKFFMAAAIEFVCLVILFVIVYFFLAKETNAVTEKETNIGSIVSFDEDGNEIRTMELEVIVRFGIIEVETSFFHLRIKKY